LALSISVDKVYDLPYAIAYGKVNWFVWQPTDISHRSWVNLSSGIKVTQERRGAPVVIEGTSHYSPSLEKELGLWFDPLPIFSKQHEFWKSLYLEHPMRMAWASPKDVEILFAAAVLSPQVSWEVNTFWMLALRKNFGENMIEIANCESKEIDTMVKSVFPEVRGMGYHAKVLVRAFKDLVDKYSDLTTILKMDAGTARKALLDVYGVGPKVAMYLVQATHGDLGAPCVDRHVCRNGVLLNVFPKYTRPYFASSCKKFIDNCSRCPKIKDCATGYLTMQPAPALLSSLLYLLN